MNALQPSVAAAETRRELGLGELEAVDVFRVLRYVERIDTVRCPFRDDSRMSGLFVRKGKRKLIVVNTARSWGHQVFTAAHEYYHIKYNSGMSGSLCRAATFDDRSPEEYDADRFSANFLVPRAGLEHLIDREFAGQELGYHEVIFLEQYFMVSHMTMLRRLEEIGRLTKKASTGLRSGVMSRARELGYSTRLYEKTMDYEVTSDLPGKVKEALERQLISEGKAREFLMSFGYEPWGEGGDSGTDVVD